MLTPEQRDVFEACGLLHLPRLVDEGIVVALRERILDLLRERRLVPDPPPPGFTVHASHPSRVLRGCAFEELWGAAGVELLDDLLGRGRWRRPASAGQVLSISFPQHGVVWRLPHQSWHLDYQAPTALRALPGVQVFVCLDRVESHAGATPVACGAHRLIDALRRREPPDWPGRSADVRKRLRAAVPWLRELCSLREGEDREARFMREPTLHDGVPLQVVELAGGPGDVFAMHPWLLHTLAPNCGARPRLVVTERIYADSV